MTGPQPARLILSEAEQTALEKLTQAHRTAQQLVLRARIILKAGAGLNNAQIGRALQVGIDMMRQWRQRWLASQTIPLTELTAAERLEDLPRPGAPVTITPGTAWPNLAGTLSHGE